MTIKCGFFNSKNGDRKYNADDFNKYFNKIISDGVFSNPSNSLQVKANEGMNVTINAGEARIRGHYFSSDAIEIISISPSDVLYPRIDRIVLRCDEDMKDITLDVITGEAKATPIPPEVERTGKIKELSLATVYVEKNTTSITQENITDTRLDTEVCGVVSVLIDQVDTATLFLQYQEAFRSDRNKRNMSFNEWFQSVKNDINQATYQLIVEDNVDSDSPDNALSARQGNYLKERSIPTKDTDIYLDTNAEINGNGTQSKPYSSIHFAFSNIPTNLRENILIIHIVSGSEIKSNNRDTTLRLPASIINGTVYFDIEDNVTFTPTKIIGNNVVVNGNLDTIEYVSLYNSKITGKADGKAYTLSLGENATANGETSLALGQSVSTEGKFSCAYGSITQAIGDCSFAGGGSTVSSGLFDFSIGTHNNCSVSTENSNGRFMIGNGVSDSYRTNAFRVENHSSQVYIGTGGQYNSSGADYAEFFEWKDGNLSNEDRVGFFVTLDEDKIKIAKKDDYILGVVSASPSIIGNSFEDWQGRYMTDDFNRILTEEIEVTNFNFKTNKEETKTVTARKQNPAYDSDENYICRGDRKEWASIGMLGVLPVRDDGSCKVNGYATVNDTGIATASIDGYRVIKRISENVIQIIFR